MNQFHFLAIFSLLVILSFFFERLALKSRIPSVFFLLISGMALRMTGDHFGVVIPGLNFLLQALGVVGLVFIVLEGALDLELNRERLPLILRAGSSAIVILGVSTFCLAAVYHWVLGQSWNISLLNAVPLSVISSAVAIPSARSLPESKREFLVYESTFSDILGILVFNFFLANRVYNHASLGRLTFDISLTLVLSSVSILALAWMIARIRDSSKFTLLFALLVLAISLGKIIHLPTLLLVFILGLAMNNSSLFLGKLGFRVGHLARLKVELRYLRRLTAEGSFCLRTLFFIIFGFSIVPKDLASWHAVKTGGAIILLLFSVRAAYFSSFERKSAIPEIFLAPRGLITVLLFYSIPKDRLLLAVGKDVVCIVILGSTCLLAISLLWFGARRTVPVGGEESLVPQARVD